MTDVLKETIHLTIITPPRTPSGDLSIDRTAVLYLRGEAADHITFVDIPPSEAAYTLLRSFILDRRRAGESYNVNIYPRDDLGRHLD